MTTTDTQVVKYFKTVRSPGGLGWPSVGLYRCRQCSYALSGAGLTRDQRMVLLARHLADVHGTGPLAA